MRIWCIKIGIVLTLHLKLITNRGILRDCLETTSYWNEKIEVLGQKIKTLKIHIMMTFFTTIGTKSTGTVSVYFALIAYNLQLSGGCHHYK